MIICLILTFLVFLYIWYVEYEQNHYIDEEILKITNRSFDRGYLIGILSVFLATLVFILINK